MPCFLQPARDVMHAHLPLRLRLSRSHGPSRTSSQISNARWLRPALLLLILPRLLCRLGHALHCSRCPAEWDAARKEQPTPRRKARTRTRAQWLRRSARHTIGGPGAGAPVQSLLGRLQSLIRVPSTSRCLRCGASPRIALAFPHGCCQWPMQTYWARACSAMATLVATPRSSLLFKDALVLPPCLHSIL
jgi:hypothetical protein